MNVDEIGLINAINELSKAVKTQDNHVLADLDTYPVTIALNEVSDELKKINLNLIAIRRELEDR